MRSAVSSTDGGGVLIFSFFRSKHRCLGKSGGSHTWLFSQHFILCSDVNIMKLSLVILVKPTDTTKNRLNMTKTRYSKMRKI